MMERRTFIASAVAMPFVGTAGAVTAETMPQTNVAAQVVDPHREWLNAWTVVMDCLGNTPCDIDDHDPNWQVRDALEERICTTQAQTADGLLAQIEFAMMEDTGFEIGTNIWKNLDGQLFGNVAQSLRAMAGEVS